MLYGLDLFSGGGGLGSALAPWIRPLAYCENDDKAAAVLLSNMGKGRIPVAPVWDDIRTFPIQTIKNFGIGIDIVYGGFPCQDISLAGAGKGLDGERSGLFWELFRIANHFQPNFIFLENVPAVLSRGGVAITEALTRQRYDCRWGVVSAASVGAPHLRKRWFLLAAKQSVAKWGREDAIVSKSDPSKPGSSNQRWIQSIRDTISNAYREQYKSDPHADGQPQTAILPANPYSFHGNNAGYGPGSTRWQFWQEAGIQQSRNAANASGAGLQIPEQPGKSGKEEQEQPTWATAPQRGWWTVEPDLDRVAYGIPDRVDRIRIMGNAVVPIQAQTAFKVLMFFIKRREVYYEFYC